MGKLQVFYGNLIRQVPACELALLHLKRALPGTSIQNFIRLQPLRDSPAPPDMDLTLTPQSFSPPDGIAPGIKGKHWDVALPVWLNGSDRPATVVANSHTVLRANGQGFALDFPSGKAEVAPSRHGVVPLDWNNDNRMDLLLAGAGGLRFFEQEKDGKFTDVTAQTNLPREVLQGDYYGAWAVDIDMDGDLDLVVAGRKGEPLLLRNNRDGTFTKKAIFPGVAAASGFAWADLDNDGAPDAVFLDAEGKLHVFMNQRGGQLSRRELPDSFPQCLALAVGDVNGDGVFDLVVLRKDGVLLRLSDRDKGTAWETAELARLDILPDRNTRRRRHPRRGRPGQQRQPRPGLDGHRPGLRLAER